LTFPSGEPLQTVAEPLNETDRTVIRLRLALILLLFGLGILPTGAAAGANCPATNHAHLAADLSAPTAVLKARPAPPTESNDHMPGTHGCQYAAGCSGVGSVEIRTPCVPLPPLFVAILFPTVSRAPRSLDLSLEDRPPRLA